MTFSYVDVSHIDASEPILPDVQGWESKTTYPLAGIDPAFLVEGCMERFWLGGQNPPAPWTSADLTAWRTLQNSPLLHCADGMGQRNEPDARGIGWLRSDVTRTDKIGNVDDETSPSYYELFQPIQLATTQADTQSLVPGRPCVFDAVKHLYQDMRKFKRYGVESWLNADDVEFIHTDTVHKDAQEGGIYSWYAGSNGRVDECVLRRTTNYGMYLETYQNPARMENWKACMQYFVIITATDPNGGYYIRHTKNACKWLDAPVRYDQTLGKYIAPLPQTYWSQSLGKQIVMETFGSDWMNPFIYEDEQGRQSQSTRCLVGINVRWLQADIVLANTEY